jgi:hypothetical protein
MTDQNDCWGDGYHSTSSPYSFPENSEARQGAHARDRLKATNESWSKPNSNIQSDGSGGAGLFGLILVGLLVPVWLPFFLPAVYLWEALTAANVHSLSKIIGCFSLCVVEAQALGFVYRRFNTLIASVLTGFYFSASYYAFSKINAPWNLIYDIARNLDYVWSIVILSSIAAAGYFIGLVLSRQFEGARPFLNRYVTLLPTVISVALVSYIAFWYQAQFNAQVTRGLITRTGPALLPVSYYVTLELPGQGHAVQRATWPDRKVCIDEVIPDPSSNFFHPRRGYVKIRDRAGQIGYALNFEIVETTFHDFQC